MATSQEVLRDVLIERALQHDLMKHPRLLPALMSGLAATHKEELDDVIQEHIHDKERPMIWLLEGTDKLPDVWLLGWRATGSVVEATDVHDHCFSRAGIYIYKGDVCERAYTLPKEGWNSGEPIAASKINRVLMEGSAMMIEAPYIHVFEAMTGMSVSIHCYFPALHEMTLYKEDKDGILNPMETWGAANPLKKRCTIVDGLYSNPSQGI